MARGGPLIVTGMVQILRNGAPLGAPLPAHIDPPSTELVDANGGLLFYEVEVPPNTPVRENDLLTILTCPSNPAMVTASARGWEISAIRPVGGLIPKTLFRARQVSQP